MPKAQALPSPWFEFLTEPDGLLAEPTGIHCMGGFILVHYYGLPRTTGDIDYYEAVPRDTPLDEIAGQGSPLHEKHKIYLQGVAVSSLCENYRDRLPIK